jgi:quinohemoprotein ethanol dehydrogenase
MTDASRSRLCRQPHRTFCNLQKIKPGLSYGILIEVMKAWEALLFVSLLAPPRSAAQSAWPKNGGDLGNRNYSPLTQIHRDNVAGLKGVWHVRLDGSGAADKYSGEAQPVYQEGIVYVVTGADDVFAVSVRTGRVVWKHQARLPVEITALCCGWISRGVALGEGKVFVGQVDGRLLALDQKTGDVVWSVQAERWQEGYSITAAPLYYDGMVITGFAGGEFAARGRVKAFNASDGRLIWTFYTIPGPGERGHETWLGNNDAWKHGGATVWQTPAVDPDLGLLYFSTGNPAPAFNGHLRAGDNLFSASIVAVEVKTGRYRWHFQQVHHDLWDYDAPNPVVLVEVKVNGRMRKGLAEAGKTGWVYLLDRATGKPLLGIDEKRVPQDARQQTSPTQPYPRGDSFVGQQVEIAPEGTDPVNQGRIFTPFWTAAVALKPSALGGANWPPSSYDPATNYLYVCANDGVQLLRSGGDDTRIVAEGQSYSGSTFGDIPLGLSGIFAAVDLRTNRLAWRQAWPAPCFSGSVATAGGLVFVGRNNGRLTALDSSSGKRLWEFQTGAGVNAPASVFEFEGVEHVAAYAAGNALIGSRHGDSLWLFSLRGTLRPADSELVTVPSESAASGAANPERGRKVFADSCSACHGASGEGGHAPALSGLRDLERIAQAVRNGGSQMPAFASRLSEQQIRDVAAYVRDNVGR